MTGFDMIKNRIERSREFTPEEAQELIEAIYEHS